MHATLTSKGQLTLPKAIRERLALSTGDKVEFELAGDDRVVLRKRSRGLDDLIGCLGHLAVEPVSDDDIERAVAEEFAERAERARR